MRVDPEGLVFGIPGFLESFSFGVSGAAPMLDPDIDMGGFGFSGGVDIVARNCCGEDGREYLEVVFSIAGGPSLGTSGKWSGSRGQNLNLYSFNQSALPTRINEAIPMQTSITINVGPFSVAIYPENGQVDVGGGFGQGFSYTTNFAKEWSLSRTEIRECCNK